MPEKRLGIDIRKDAIRAVVVKAGLKTDTIQAVAEVPLSAEPEENGLDIALSLLFDELKKQTDIANITTHASFANGCVSFRNLTVPFGEPKKIRQVLPFELEAILPLRPEEFVADYHVVRKAESTECIAMAVPIDAVAAQLEAFGPHPAAVESLTVSGVSSALVFLNQDSAPDQGIFLEISSQKTLVILFLGKSIVTIRCMEGDFSENLPALCMGIEFTIRGYAEKSGIAFSPQSLVITGEGAHWPGLEDHLAARFHLSVKQADLAKNTGTTLDPGTTEAWEPHTMDPALALALYDPTETRGFNMRQGPFAVRKRWQEYKGTIIHLGVLALVVVLALSANFFMDLHALNAESRDLGKQIQAEFKKILPETAPQKDQEVNQVKAAIRQTKKTAALPGDEAPPARVINILAELSKSIETGVDVKLKSFIMTGQEIKIKGTTDTFKVPDDIEAAIAKSPLFSKVTLLSTDTVEKGKSGKVRFRIKANVRPQKR